MNKREACAIITATAALTGCGLPFGGADAKETLPPSTSLDIEAINELAPTIPATTSDIPTTTAAKEITQTSATSSTEAASTEQVAATMTTLPTIYIPVEVVPAGTVAEIPSTAAPEAQSPQEVASIQFVFPNDGLLYVCFPASVTPEPQVHPEHATQSGFIAEVNGFELEAGFGSFALNQALGHPNLFPGLDQYTPEDDNPDTVPYCGVV